MLFTATSLAAAFVNTIEQLIVIRALQGLGAAFIMPLSLSLISAAFPPEERGKAVGIWSAVSVSSVALGPVVGGAIIEYFTWQWIFLVNVPIGILAFLVTQAVRAQPRRPGPRFSREGLMFRRPCGRRLAERTPLWKP